MRERARTGGFGEGAGGSVTKFGGGGWAVGLADDGADTDLESEVA